MAERGEPLSPISFIYEYLRHGWAHASISDGNATYDMIPSYVPTDPLFVLVHAVVEVLRYGSDARCSWFYEPATDQWMLRREDDTLHITIRREKYGFSHPSWPEEGGKVEFTTSCDLWKFAAKVRLAVSRMVPVEEQEHNYGPASVQQTVEYRALCVFVDERKESQSLRPGKRTK